MYTYIFHLLKSQILISESNYLLYNQKPCRSSLIPDQLALPYRNFTIDSLFYHFRLLRCCPVLFYHPVQFSCGQLFVTPWTAACQASLSITDSWSLLKLMSLESVMPSNHLILCHPLLLLPIFPSIRSFLMSQLFTSGSQTTGVSASASVLSVNIED